MLQKNITIPVNASPELLNLLLEAVRHVHTSEEDSALWPEWTWSAMELLASAGTYCFWCQDTRVGFDRHGEPMACTHCQDGGRAASSVPAPVATKPVSVVWTSIVQGVYRLNRLTMRSQYSADWMRAVPAVADVLGALSNRAAELEAAVTEVDLDTAFDLTTLAAAAQR